MRESPPAISAVPPSVPARRVRAGWRERPRRWARSLVVSMMIFGCATADPESPPRSGAEGELPEVLASWSGGEVTLDALQAQIGEELRELEIRFRLTRYERMAQLVDDLIDRALLEEEARRQGLTGPEALLVLEVEEKTPRPTRAQVEAAYPALVAQVGRDLPDRVHPMLQDELWHRAQEARYREYVGTLRARSGLQIALPYPELPRVDIPISAHDPKLGPEDAPITLVEFADHTCPWCGPSSELVAKVRERWPQEVQIVWKDFPLPSNRRALPAAVAAHCAGDQGSFWEMRARLLSAPYALEDLDLIAHAEGLDLDPAAFEDCLGSGRHVRRIHEDLAVAHRAGVRGAPTFLINGLLVPGVQPWERIAGVIERELDRASR